MKKSKSKNSKNSKPLEKKSNIFKNIALFFTVFFITYLFSYMFFNFGVAFYYVFPLSAAFISVALNIISKKVTPESKSASYIYIVLSVVILSLSILSILAAMNMTPFGNMTILILDSFNQYAPFILALKDMLSSGDGFLYSNKLGLGSDFFGLFAYYLTSIYNIIMLIFPKSMFVFSYSLMTFLKFITIPVTFGIFYQRTYKRKDFTVVLFSLAYSLMSYIVVQITNIMWIDCIILFPLIIMYLNELLEKGEALKYTVVLALAIISNYYIAYMICIYLVLYYIAYVFINTEKFNLKEQLKKLWKFIYSSVLSAGAAAIIIIPTIHNLSKTLNINNSNTFNSDCWNYNPLLSFERFFPFKDAALFPGTVPNVYCSIFVLFLLALFLICNKISWKKKLSYSLICLFILFSLCFYPLDFIWHGFHEPIYLPGRYSFLLSFTIIIMAIDTANNFNSINLKGLFIELIFIPLFIIICIFRGSGALTSIIGAAVFLIAYTAIMILYKKKLLIKQTALILSVLLVFSEMTASSVFSRHFKNSYYPDLYTINAKLSLDKVIENIEENDQGIYRLDRADSYSYFDSLNNTAKTLTFYSSTNNGKIIKFMNNTGYNTNKINYYIHNYNVPLINSLLGLKYSIFHQKPEKNIPYLNFLYSKNYYNTDFYVYKNTSYYGIGSALTNDIKNWDINTDDPFECQNRLSRILIGKNIYEKVPIDFNTKGFKINEDGSVYFDENYKKAEINIDINSDGIYYFSHRVKTADFLELKNQDNLIFIDQDPNSISILENSIHDLNNLEAGEKLTYSVTGGSGKANCYLYRLNESALSEAIEKIKSTPYEIDTFKNNYIKGSINMKESGTLFLSIVNDGDWTVTVDGKETEITEIAECFIGVPLDTGEHTVEFHYHNYSVLLGAVITLISIGLIVFIALFQKKKKCKNTKTK